MRLIVNADDFGLTRGVSEGILEGMRGGIITDTSAIVSAPGFAESARLALDAGVTEMGLHCLLTMGRPVLPAEKVPSLVNEEGKFFTPRELKSRFVDPAEVALELEAQLDLLLRSGLKLNHIDTHHGFMHLSEDVTALFIDLARRYQVPLRNEASHFHRPDLVERCRRAGVTMTDHLYLNRGTSHHRKEDVAAFLREAPDLYQTVEMCCHAGYSGPLLRQLSPLNDDREKDLAVCLDRGIAEQLRRSNVQLIRYSEL